MLPEIKESIVVVQLVPICAYGGKQLLKLLFLFVEPWLILTTDEFFPEGGLGHLIFILQLRQFATDHPGHQKAANTREEAHPDERTGHGRQEWHLHAMAEGTQNRYEPDERKNGTHHGQSDGFHDFGKPCDIFLDALAGPFALRRCAPRGCQTLERH